MMTLAIGKATCHSRRREGGFTLIEIMVVMAIVVTLFAIVAVGIGGLQGRAKDKATRALISRIQQWLDDYKNLTGVYPPDGFDSAVTIADGTAIRGSACLYYFLSKQPVPVRERRAGKDFVSELPPMANFTGSELSTPDPAHPDVREVVDAFGNALHYDNTENGEFRPQRGEVHFPPLDDDEHPVDPRDGTYEVGPENAVREPGIQGTGFDVWSYGEQEHEVKEIKYLPIATWNMKQD